jgi:hypothetical protein
MDLADLTQGVKNEVKRQQFFDPLGNDVTTTAVPGFVNQALRSIQRLLVIRDAEVTANFTVGPENHPYPVSNFSPPFRYSEELWITGQSSPLHRYQTVREFHQDYPPGTPIGAGAFIRGYCIYDGSINLGPAPQNDWNFFMDYVTWLQPLTLDTDSNWYTLNADDAVLFYSCRQAAAWLMEDQLYQFYDQLGGRALDEVRKTIRAEEVSEGQLQGRLFGSFRSTGQPTARSGLSRRSVGWWP